MSASDRVLREIGRIVRTHGVKGELKIAPETDDPERFSRLDTLYIGPEEHSVSVYSVDSTRYQTTRHGLTVILGLQGITDLSAAGMLMGLRVFADESDLPPLEENEFYFSDLIGLEVWTDNEVRIGTVKDVLENSAQEILLIRLEKGGERMIPAVPEFIREVDLITGRVVISVIDGLI